MNIRLSAFVFAVVAASIAVAPTRADDAPTFESLQQTGFASVAAPTSLAAPSAAPAPRPSGDERGVYLFSNRSGQIFFCSASGCRQILDGDAGSVLRAKDGLYFTGPNRTGYCTPSACRVLLPAALTLPLSSGPNGDVYGLASTSGLWHCTPTACDSALPRTFDASALSNFIEGEWKTGGDFVGAAGDATFWCSGDSCRVVGNSSLVFVQNQCRGDAPARLAYGFWGLDFYRCSPNGCRKIASDDPNIDRYTDCGFDAAGNLYLPARSGASVRCGGDCAPSTVQINALGNLPSAQSKTSSWRTLTGSDGAAYSLADRSTTPEPTLGFDASALPPVVLRDGTPLTFDAPVGCWQWEASGDDDEEPTPAAWTQECRLER